MRKNIFFNHLSFLVILIIHVLYVKRGRSEEYIVGDGDEWSSQGNFLLWSQKYNFTVGDVLVFKYRKGQHDVFEVEEKTFRSCDTSSGVVAKYESGNDRVELTEAKKRWFICNIEGHCFGGMRFGIDVKSQVDNFSPSSQPNQDIPTSPSTSSCGTNTRFMTRSRRIGIFIISLGILLKLN